MSVASFRLQPRMVVLAMALLVLAIAVKWWYRTATLDQLDFVLWPVANAITLFTGATWIVVPGEGYVFRSLGMVIDRSCSGINFMVIVWITFAFVLLRRSAAGCLSPYMALLAGVAAYLLTILTNTGRILSMVMLHQQEIQLGQKQHEGLGAFFFISILVLSSMLLDRSLQRHTTHATLA